MKLKIFGLSMAVALLASVGVMTAAPGGSAASAGTTCSPPSGNLTITPGLTATPTIQTIIIKLPVKGCKGGGVTGGTSVGTSKGTTKQTCTTYFSAAAKGGTSVADTITWTPKSMGTSTFTANTKSVPGKSSLTASLTGRITKGTFLGKTVSTTVVVTLNGKCTPSSPLKSITIKGTKPLVIK